MEERAVSNLWASQEDQPGRPEEGGLWAEHLGPPTSSYTRTPSPHVTAFIDGTFRVQLRLNGVTEEAPDLIRLVCS